MRASVTSSLWILITATLAAGCDDDSGAGAPGGGEGGTAAAGANGGSGPSSTVSTGGASAAGGASGSGGGGGAGQGGGSGASSCEDGGARYAHCQACRAVELRAGCCGAAVETCTFSDACNGFLACKQACATDACEQQCHATHAEGAALYDAIQTCLLGDGTDLHPGACGEVCSDAVACHDGGFHYADCAQCTAGELFQCCEDAALECQADAGCLAFGACLDDCGYDKACIDECASEDPDPASGYDALAACWFGRGDAQDVGACGIVCAP